MKTLCISIFLILLIPLFIYNCNDKKQNSSTNQTFSSNTSIDKSAISSLSTNQKSNRLDVYYFHRTKRCHGCLNLEKMMHDALKQLEANIITGVINVKIVDIEKEEEYVSRYNLTMPGITVVSIKNNNAIKYKNLEDAWQLTDNVIKFNDFIKVELDNALKEVL